MNLNIERIITGPIDCNSYVVYKEGSNTCFVVDPADFELIDSYLTNKGLSVDAILVTHGHYDHILAVADLKRKYNAKVYIHVLDAECLSSTKLSLAIFMGATVNPTQADVRLNDGDKFTAAGIAVETLHTPGHSMGSVSFVLPEHRVIFSGDTLFRLSVGRADLYGSDARQLEDSLLHKLYALEGDYRVLPGHMRETTLAFEREHNPYTKHLK
ncbi:MAG TPA: MBL fold metallo-hydrolase [Clostridiales bacterium]|jgi:hydroxyacylglutathione hydrolase|nr:MBL fold metallo-hydrolase [Clostridiales bacterium]